MVSSRSGSGQPSHPAKGEWVRPVRRRQDSPLAAGTPVRAQCVSRRRRCGGFGVQWTPYLLAQHSTLLSSNASHVFGGWRHGPCHRPACPFCHGGQTRTPTGLDWSCRHPIPCCRGRGTASTVWCVSAGRTPVFPNWFRRLSYRSFDPERAKSCGCTTKRAIHARCERRDSLAESR